MGKNIIQLQAHICEKDISIGEYRKLGTYFDSIGVESYNTLQMFAALAISRLGPWHCRVV